MPNHVTNVLTLHGEPEQIRAMLEAIQYDDLGIGSVDFNKIIPMPEKPEYRGRQPDEYRPESLSGFYRGLHPRRNDPSGRS